MPLDRARFEQMLPMDRLADKRVLIVGCGGIGSYTGALLARMGLQDFRLVDFDRVDPVNIATQDFPAQEVGSPKVTSLHARIQGINREALVLQVNRAFEPADVRGRSVVIASTDNIEARRSIWEAVVVDGMPDTLVIDPRMGAESLDLYVVRRGGQMADWYRDVLAEEGYSEQACGARAIAYTGAFAGAAVASALRRGLMEPTWEAWIHGDIGAFGLKVMKEMR